MTKPKKNPCPNCQEQNHANNKQCAKCFALLPTKAKLKAKLDKYNKEWSESVKRNKNVSREFDSARVMVGRLDALGFKPILLYGTQHGNRWDAHIRHQLPLTPMSKKLLENIHKGYEYLLNTTADRPEGGSDQGKSSEEQPSTSQETASPPEKMVILTLVPDEQSSPLQTPTSTIMSSTDPSLTSPALSAPPSTLPSPSVPCASVSPPLTSPVLSAEIVPVEPSATSSPPAVTCVSHSLTSEAFMAEMETSSSMSSLTAGSACLTSPTPSAEMVPAEPSAPHPHTQEKQEKNDSSCERGQQEGQKRSWSKSED